MTATAENPAPAPAPMRGVAIGCVRTVPLVEAIPPRAPEETEEAFAARARRWSALQSIQVQVRHLARRRCQEIALRMTAARAAVTELPKDSPPAAMQAALEPYRQACRALLLERCIDRRKGDTGAVLAGVSGPVIEQDDGTVKALADMTEVDELVEALEELDLEELVAQAALGAQEVTRLWGN